MMAPAQSINEQNAAKLKSALWYSVGQTVDAVSIEQDINATPQFIGALAEMLYTQIGTLVSHKIVRANPMLTSM
jgi:centromere protein S